MAYYVSLTFSSILSINLGMHAGIEMLLLVLAIKHCYILNESAKKVARIVYLLKEIQYEKIIDKNQDIF